MDTYRERMGYYRKGRGTKPLGFHMIVNAEGMTDENWYKMAHQLIADKQLSLLDTYNGFKQLHQARLEATATARYAEPVSV